MKYLLIVIIVGNAGQQGTGGVDMHHVPFANAQLCEVARQELINAPSKGFNVRYATCTRSADADEAYQ